ncbi:MAG: HEPN domain-containing protein, partial [Rhodococcus sp.]|nr:HEPN domain-containing protein [Rhodococcus sp. (in: high G+C Gram-positive bacteria)]
MMETLNERLAAILNEASFEVEYRNGDGPNRGVSAAELSALYFHPEEQAVNRRARLLTPRALLEQLVGALRLALEPFIDPDTDEVGHAFPISMNCRGRTAFHNSGYCDKEFVSSLPNFARDLVQGAAIVGIGEITRLLAGWARGEPVRTHLSTVLNNLPLSAPVSVRDDIHLIPLALTTSQLPRLPDISGIPTADYLGMTVLTFHISAAPALFRPNAEGRDQTVRSKPAEGADLDLVCHLLSLQANRHVAQSVVWHDYPDTPFRFTVDEHWSRSDDRLSPRSSKLRTCYPETGEVATMVPADEPVQPLNPDELCDMLKTLAGADRKLRIAVDRWRRSKRATLAVDAYIDLRIALEALYLKDFAGETSGEMRFRLSLVGAWHLSADPAERRSIRKTLRDAYDTASGAVHTGEIRDEHRVKLSDAQDLCRRGILKLLREGPPQDWGDLVLGADAGALLPAGTLPCSSTP